VTHLVVREDSSPNTEYIVPVDIVTETITDTIRLHCSKAELEKMDPFIKTTFVEEKLPDYSAYGGGYGSGMVYWPYASYEETVEMPVEHREIPAGELAVQRGTVWRQRMVMWVKSMSLWSTLKTVISLIW